MEVLQIGAATLEDIYQKYGSLDPLEEINWRGVVADRIYILVPSSKCFGLIRLKYVDIVHFRQFPSGQIGLALSTLLSGLMLFLKRRFHIVHCRVWNGSLLGAWLLSRIIKRPFAVSIHTDYDKLYELAGPAGAPILFRSRAVAKRLQRIVLRRADLVMPIRKSLKKKAVEDGAKTERVRIIPHGIDLKAFNQRPSCDVRSFFGIGNDQKIVSFVGRLSRENYVDDVLALAQSLAHRGDFIIVMAGGGPEEERLRQEITSDQSLSDYIRLLGFQPREVVIDLRRASSVSLCFMGGFSLIEACAAGRPVVAYDVAWHKELINDGETGILLTEGDTRGAARAVEYLLDHPVEAEQLGERARALAFERHDISKTSKIKWAYYRELLANCRLG